nr:glycosyltransferase family 2 protein [uncultured Rhodopila sp.]
MTGFGNSSVTVCAIARDEGPYLLEWVAWYKFLAFDRIVIYDNESRDKSTGILAALHRAGEIVHRPWPDRPGEQPQLPAYRDAVSRCSTEWIAFLDIDEFLVLHAMPRIADLVQGLPEECSGVAFNQRFFGSAGLRHYDSRMVIERFTRSSRPDHILSVWIKSMVRARKVNAINSPHSCELASGYYAEPGGRRCDIEAVSWIREISFDVAQYNHYILKSRAEYLDKRAKGRVDLEPGHPERFDKYTDEFFDLHDENVCEDISAARWAELVRVERDRLARLCPG